MTARISSPTSTNINIQWTSHDAYGNGILYEVPRSDLQHGDAGTWIVIGPYHVNVHVEEVPPLTYLSCAEETFGDNCSCAIKWIEARTPKEEKGVPVGKDNTPPGYTENRDYFVRTGVRPTELLAYMRIL